MRAKLFSDLPAVAHCNKCDKDKPLAEMIVFRLASDGLYHLRKKCKECASAYNRTFQEWRREYLRKWRKENPELNRSYWDNPEVKERSLQYTRKFNTINREAILIKNRLRRHGQPCTIAEAREYLKKYGPNFPTIHGLTSAGKREVQRIRSAYRRAGRQITAFEIRLMVYEDSAEEPRLLKKPSTQKFPYKTSAHRLRTWHQQQRRLHESNNRTETA
jgi:hypothetical protein